MITWIIEIHDCPWRPSIHFKPFRSRAAARNALAEFKLKQKPKLEYRVAKYVRAD